MFGHPGGGAGGDDLDFACHGFNKEDEITIVFCGSKKSMATGVPMAQVLFAGGAVGPAILPLMIFHQIQLMVCAVMAQHYARREEPGMVSAA